MTFSRQQGSIKRVRKGKHFEYFREKGTSKNKVTDAHTIKRINSLRIPPGYNDVVISPSPSDKVQAYGFDNRNRKQSVYNKAFIDAQKVKKFADLEGFEHVLQKIKADIDTSLRSKSADVRSLLIKLVVKLAMLCHLRIGNDKYVKENQSYGLTTLLCKHVTLTGNKATFDFSGKKAVRNIATCNEPAALKILAALKKGKSPNDRLFEYKDQMGRIRVIDSSAVNDYLKSFDPNITSKDIRTWEANRLFVTHYREIARREQPRSETAWKQVMRETLKKVAERLHHTPAVAKASYIHGDLISNLENSPSFRARLLNGKSR